MRKVSVKPTIIKIYKIYFHEIFIKMFKIKLYSINACTSKNIFEKINEKNLTILKSPLSLHRFSRKAQKTSSLVRSSIG